MLICLTSLLLLFIKKSFIENETAAFEFLQDRPEGAILQWISTLQFLSIPLIYAWKFTVIGFVLYTACFLYGYKISFSQCWGIALTSEFIFLIPETLKIIWFLTVKQDPTLYDIRAFYPLSLMHFFDYYSLDKKWAYPLKALNVFEILYWWLLYLGLHQLINRSRKIILYLVTSTYIPLFFLWLAYYLIVYK